MFTVLLVDDEELVRVSVGFSVRGAMSGVQVIGEAANGLEGLKRIREEHPDIVITDIRMPKLDGLQMIRAIREESLDIEVVVLSGYADFEYARQAMKYGVTEYLLRGVLRPGPGLVWQLDLHGLPLGGVLLRLPALDLLLRHGPDGRRLFPGCPARGKLHNAGGLFIPGWGPGGGLSGPAAVL